jgi:Cu+-exporting ATPase
VSKIRCDHCHLEADEDVMIKDGDLYFCCKGCQGVYHLLADEGLDTFYDKVGDRELAPPVEADSELNRFDLDSFVDRYVTKDGDIHKIPLIIEGIHCSACIWLNEKILNRTDGIIEANINYTNHKATITYDSTKIKLSQIIEKIRLIGYNAYPYDPKLQEERASKTRKDYYLKMMVALFSAMNIMMLAVAKYTGYFKGVDDDIRNIFHYTEFFLATPVLFYTGSIFFKGAYYGLKNRMINMDFLVITGASLTYIYSIYVLISENGQSYFDSVVMIITFVLIGKFLEVISKKSVADTLDTINSQIPTEVTIIKDGEKSIIANEEVKVGDIIEVKEGQKVVIDGEIIAGEGSFDYSALSGESMPIVKSKGDTILSGAISIDSMIRYKATKEFSQSTLNSIVNLIEESLNKKPDIENRANALSGYFSLVILLISIFTFVGWYALDGMFENALINAISVIVIACPCALALATPVATLVGISITSKKGLIFKETKFLETMAKADTLVVDKTGTITEGRPQVSNFVQIEEFDKSLLYSLISASSHPISKGVKEYITQDGLLKDYGLDSIKVITAKGLSSEYEGKSIFGGSLEYLNSNNISHTIDTTSSIFAYVVDDKLVAYFELEDKLKEGAIESISYIKSLGVDVIMLTGDNENSAKSIADMVGIDKYVANMLPQDKADYIDRLHEENKIVVMAGDGINDSIALSKSDIAIAMGGGTDVAISVSDVVIMNNSFESIKTAFISSRRTYKFIKQNLAISLIYNSLTIPLAVMGYVIPFVAAISMSISSLLVVANSFRIKFGLDK